MATERQVLKALGDQHPASAVTVFDGSRPDVPVLAERAGLDGGGAVLVFLDPDPDALGIKAGSIGLEGLGR